MNVRVVTAAAVVLALAAGGAAWWVLRDDEAPPAPRPIASCAPANPRGDVATTYWGMHVATPIGDEFPDAPVGSVNLTTSQVYWNQVETAPGQYDFTRLDQIVDSAETHDARPMVVLGATPAFHTARPGSATASAMMPDADAWRAWVTAVVERYGTRLDYQVWPEPNITGNWSGTPEQMAGLSVTAGTIIHDREPKALVVAPATTLRTPGQREWMSRYWATEVDGHPVADSVDAVALDPFPMEDGGPEDSLDLVCQARKILAQHDVDLPVWTNEINYGVPSGGTLTATPLKDDDQAAAVARTYLLQAAMGIDRVYWLGWFDSPGLSVAMVRDGATTAAGEAFTTVHDWMADAPRPRCQRAEGVYTCVAKRAKDSMRIVWSVGDTTEVRAGTGATSVLGLDGKRQDVSKGDPVEVSESPVAIVERRAG